MKIEVGNGEVIDKVTILEIKSERISDEQKLKNVKSERGALTPAVEEIYQSLSESDRESFDAFRKELKEINEALWVVEDQLRECERKGIFEEEFVSLARSVYLLNDRRAAVKRFINELTKSVLIEEKSYEDYSSKEEL